MWFGKVGFNFGPAESFSCDSWVNEVSAELFRLQDELSVGALKHVRHHRPPKHVHVQHHQTQAQLHFNHLRKSSSMHRHPIIYRRWCSDCSGSLHRFIIQSGGKEPIIAGRTSHNASVSQSIHMIDLHVPLCKNSLPSSYLPSIGLCVQSRWIGIAIIVCLNGSLGSGFFSTWKA